jgi:hypothetical protein
VSVPRTLLASPVEERAVVVSVVLLHHDLQRVDGGPVEQVPRVDAVGPVAAGGQRGTEQAVRLGAGRRGRSASEWQLVFPRLKCSSCCCCYRGRKCSWVLKTQQQTLPDGSI